MTEFRHNAVVRAGNILRMFGVNPSFVHRYDPQRSCEWAMEIISREGPSAQVSESPISGRLTTTYTIGNRFPTHCPLDPRAD